MAYILDTNIVIKLNQDAIPADKIFQKSKITSVTLKEIFKSLEKNYVRNKSTIKYIVDNKINIDKTDIEEIIYCKPFGLDKYNIPGIYDYDVEVKNVLTYPTYDAYKRRVMDTSIIEKAGLEDKDPSMVNTVMESIMGTVNDFKNSYDLLAWEYSLETIIKQLNNKSKNRIKLELIKNLIIKSLKIRQIKPKSKIVKKYLEKFQCSKYSDQLDLFLEALSLYISEGKKKHRNDSADINILSFVTDIDTLVTADQSFRNLVNSISPKRAISYEEYLSLINV